MVAVVTVHETCENYKQIQKEGRRHGDTTGKKNAILLSVTDRKFQMGYGRMLGTERSQGGFALGSSVGKVTNTVSLVM